MHWMLDTAFGEDACRKRAEERAENFARIRQMCLNMLKSETTLKASIKHKRAMCAMDPEYLLKVLGSLYLRECSLFFREHWLFFKGDLVPEVLSCCLKVGRRREDAQLCCAVQVKKSVTT